MQLPLPLTRANQRPKEEKQIASVGIVVISALGENYKTIGSQRVENSHRLLQTSTIAWTVARMEMN